MLPSTENIYDFAKQNLVSLSQIFYAMRRYQLKYWLPGLLNKIHRNHTFKEENLAFYFFIFFHRRIVENHKTLGLGHLEKVELDPNVKIDLEGNEQGVHEQTTSQAHQDPGNEMEQILT